jgi:hypothetical protein
MRHKRRIDWEQVGNLVLALLHMVSERDARFREEARRRDITVEQLTAAAIVGAIRELIGNDDRETAGRTSLLLPLDGAGGRSQSQGADGRDESVDGSVPAA